VRDRALLRVVLPAAAAAVAAAAGLGLAVARGEILAALAFAAAFALGHLFPLHSGGGRLQPLGPAVAAAAALGSSLAPAVCGAGLGLLAGWLLARWRFGERASADLLPGEAAGVAAFAGVFAVLDGVLPHDGNSWVHLAMLVPAGAAWHLASSGARTGWTETRRRLAAGLLWRTALNDWPAYLVLITAGGLYGATREAMGWWAVLLAALPYAFSHLAFTRLAAAAATYDQTIRALGRVPEAGGFALPGHAERTADVAVAIGAELGLAPAETRRVEQAALLAEIGRVVLGGPALASAGGYTVRDLAQWSAAIVGEAPALKQVAAIVGEAYRPYRRPGEERDLGLPAAAQVVKVATAYDYAVGGGMEPVDALEVLHRGTAYDYDPEIVAALRRVLQRRGCPGV
jgi:hypothetical protein